jgi:hypothetical protein
MKPMSMRDLQKIEQAWKAFAGTGDNTTRLLLNYIADLAVEVRNYLESTPCPQCVDKGCSRCHGKGIVFKPEYPGGK